MSVDRSGQHFEVAANHPSFAGHFPDNPVVAGVLLLDEVLAMASALLGREAVPLALPQVKFLHTLGPAQAATVSFAIEDRRLRFSIESAGRVLARGEFQLA